MKILYFFSIAVACTLFFNMLTCQERTLFKTLISIPIHDQAVIVITREEYQNICFNLYLNNTRNAPLLCRKFYCLNTSPHMLPFITVGEICALTEKNSRFLTIQEKKKVEDMLHTLSTEMKRIDLDSAPEFAPTNTPFDRKKQSIFY